MWKGIKGILGNYGERRGTKYEKAQIHQIQFMGQNRFVAFQGFKTFFHIVSKNKLKKQQEVTSESKSHLKNKWELRALYTALNQN